MVNILDTIKNLLNIDKSDCSKDFIINFIIDDVSRFVLNYCNLEDLPCDLYFTVINMCIKKYNYFLDNSFNVKSISEGDVSITFNQFANQKFFSSFFDELNLFRRFSD